MTGVRQPERRLLMAADMERYSGRRNLQQVAAQRTFKEILDQAAAAVRLDRPTWTTQPTGDGELAILPAGTPEPVVLARLVPEIDRLLREHNRSLLPVAKVRLRVALHQGMVHLDGANGFPGNAVVETCRLLDARPLKRALKALSEAAVALIVSDAIYNDVVNEYYEGLRPERFARVEVSIPDKNFRAVAWICVIDEDIRTVGDLGDPPPEAAAPEASPPSEAGGGDRSAPDRSRGVPGSRTTVNHGVYAVGPDAVAIGQINGGATFGGGEQR
jgi:hypothetical protein